MRDGLQLSVCGDGGNTNTTARRSRSTKGHGILFRKRSPWEQNTERDGAERDRK